MRGEVVIYCIGLVPAMAGVAMGQSENATLAQSSRLADAEARPVVRLQGVPRFVAQLRHLQRKLHSDFGLSAERASAIDALFAEYISALESTGAGGRPFGSGREDLEEFRLLQERMQAARDDGDDAVLATLTSRYEEMLQSRQTAYGLTLNQFYARVIENLDEGQTIRFRALVKHLRIGDDQPPMHPALARMLRATELSLLQLSPEQRRKIAAIVREGAWDVAQAEMTEGDVAAAIEKVRQAVTGQLDRRQESLFGVATSARKPGINKPIDKSKNP
jgi:hypothetical protein